MADQDLEIRPEDVNFDNKTLNFRPFPRRGNVQPTEMIVREIDFTFDPEQNILKIAFSKGWGPVPMTRTDFPDALTAICAGRYPGQEVRTHMVAGRDLSPLSLNNSQKIRYIVYVLSDKNWQFARSGTPLTISSEHYDLELYSEAQRVDAFGTADDGSAEGAEKDRCRVAYFVANGIKAHADAPNRDYVHRLNLHVDIYNADDGGTILPLIIDPDIRYPGGST